jgi:hypothetical protein
VRSIDSCASLSCKHSRSVGISPHDCREQERLPQLAKGPNVASKCVRVVNWSEMKD